MPCCLRRILAFLVVFVIPACSVAQRRLQLPVSRNVSQLVRSSAYIFSGTVVATEPVGPANPNQLGAVRVTFRVEEAIRGVEAGQTLVIKQWAGLWASGQGYRVGDRVLLFLHPPSRLGLTSPVGGAMGRYKVDHNGQILLDQLKSNPLWNAPQLTGPRPPGSISIAARELARGLRRVGRE